MTAEVVRPRIAFLIALQTQRATHLGLQPDDRPSLTGQFHFVQNLLGETNTSPRSFTPADKVASKRLRAQDLFLPAIFT
ncbi:MAG: hypothetical protein KDB00_14345 [Planctomycetales bacterium]|nr:hypothetical protein [Planctomycetales bacterium]